MSLREKIEQYKEKSAGKASPEMIAVMSAATAGVQDSVATRKIPTVGEKFPNFVLPDSHGNPVDSSVLLQSGPLVVTFFRGMW